MTQPHDFWVVHRQTLTSFILIYAAFGFAISPISLRVAVVRKLVDAEDLQAIQALSVLLSFVCKIMVLHATEWERCQTRT